MKFEDLEAWKSARREVNRVYGISRDDSLGRDFGLCSQIQRATVSVMTNILAREVAYAPQGSDLALQHYA